MAQWASCSGGIQIGDAEPGVGQGLFATIEFERGDVVMKMLEPQLLSESHFESLRAQRGLPEWSCMHCKLPGVGSEMVVFDAAWEGGTATRPLWTYANHGLKRRNLKICYSRDAAGSFTVWWEALKRVRVGKQLRWKYENAERTWNADEPPDSDSD